MTLNQKINLKGHFTHRGLFPVPRLSVGQAVFYVYPLSGRSAPDLARSPFMLPKRPR